MTSQLAEPTVETYAAPIRLFKIAKITSNLTGTESVIVVRQLSRNFAWFDAHVSLLIGESVELDFDDTGSISGIVTQKITNSYLMQFTEACAHVERIEMSTQSAESRLKRRPRVTTGRPITLNADGGNFSATLQNISFGGAKIVTAMPLTGQRKIKLCSWNRLSITGQVTWQENGEVGVVFDRKLSLQELLAWSD